MGNFYSTSASVEGEIQTGLAEFPTLFPFNNPSVLAFVQKNCLKLEWIGSLKDKFFELDKHCNGHLSCKEFLQLINERQGSDVGLYGERLYLMTKIRIPGKMDFLEFCQTVLEYGILDVRSVIRFVFRLIDTDNDEVISLKDVHNFVTLKFSDLGCFSPNCASLVEKIQLDEEIINAEAFWRYKEQFDFIIFPAFLLQEKIQAFVLGGSFWDE